MGLRAGSRGVNINANRFSYKAFSLSLRKIRNRNLSSAFLHAQNFFHFFYYCVSFTNEIEKLCLITGIYIRHCSSDSPPIERAFFCEAFSFFFPSSPPSSKAEQFHINTFHWKHLYMTFFHFSRGLYWWKNYEECRINSHTKIWEFGDVWAMGGMTACDAYWDRLWCFGFFFDGIWNILPSFISWNHSSKSS